MFLRTLQPISPRCRQLRNLQSCASSRISGNCQTTSAGSGCFNSRMLNPGVSATQESCPSPRPKIFFQCSYIVKLGMGSGMAPDAKIVLHNARTQIKPGHQSIEQAGLADGRMGPAITDTLPCIILTRSSRPSSVFALTNVTKYPRGS